MGKEQGYVTTLYEKTSDSRAESANFGAALLVSGAMRFPDLGSPTNIMKLAMITMRIRN